MKKLIEQFPDQIREALSLSLDLPKYDSKKIQNIVIAGLGGSGITGVMVKKMLEPILSIPTQTLCSYDIPAYINEHTLFIISSYSGNTEETLSMMHKAITKNALIFAISAGGKLHELAHKHLIPSILIPSGRPPRASIAYSLVTIFRLLEGLNLVGKENYTKKFEHIATFLEKNAENIQEEAKEISSYLNEKIPIIYAQDANEALAVRFRQQLNENSKMLAWHHVIPEMNHNEIVGFEGKANHVAVLLLRLGNENDQENIRFDFLAELLSQSAVPIRTLVGQGKNYFENYFYIFQVLDWVSVFLAEIAGIDPTPVATITLLKNRLG
jgi:glucose/mannose-6-phosphate isomerase